MSTVSGLQNFSFRERRPENDTVPVKSFLRNLIENMANENEFNRVQWFKSRRIRTRIDVSASHCHENSRCMGDIRLMKIRSMLNSFGMTRSADQVQFHDAFICSSLQIIYGSDFEANFKRIMEENQLKCLHKEVMIVAPRRFGKTVAIAMFVAACLLCIPGVRINIYSTGKRASGSLMEAVIKFIKRIPGGESRMASETQEVLYVSQTAVGGGSGSHAARSAKTDEGTSKLCSFPSNPKGYTLRTTTRLHLFAYFRAGTKFADHAAFARRLSLVSSSSRLSHHTHASKHARMQAVLCILHRTKHGSYNARPSRA
jgi:hypothetical protein